MKSTSGEHYVALDHVRAIATYMVFVWHFTHSHYGYPVPFEAVPTIFPLALLEEGHTGVSLFMTLSGYLFAKLLNGKSIHWPAFYWNRFLRLFPLLFLVILVYVFREARAHPSPDGYISSLAGYGRKMLAGFIFPNWPNGGWSIAVELHFYLLLPAFLWLQAKTRFPLLLLVGLALVFRGWLYWEHGEIQHLAYWTLVGRIDQFVLGVVAFKYGQNMKARHVLAAGVLFAFSLFYWWFDMQGGDHGAHDNPNMKSVWIYLGTIEGLAYALLIAYYDNTLKNSSGAFSRVLSRVGEYSYSIYLLHVLLVFWMARNIHENIMNISNFYMALPWATLGFLVMVPIGYLSYRFIESPFLRYRRKYITLKID